MEYRELRSGEIVVLKVEQWEYQWRFRAYEPVRSEAVYPATTLFEGQHYGLITGERAIIAIYEAYPETTAGKANMPEGSVLLPMTSAEAPYATLRGSDHHAA